jgi:hypothetical protein
MNFIARISLILVFVCESASPFFRHLQHADASHQLPPSFPDAPSVSAVRVRYADMNIALESYSNVANLVYVK